MKITYHLYSSIAFLLLTLHSPSKALSSEHVKGIWQGSLKAGAVELRIVFHLETDSTGMWKTTMDSPDQGARGIVVDKTSVLGDSITLTISNIGGEYTGVKQEGDSLIIGKWSQGGASFPLDLHRTAKLEEAVRPQEPKPPFPYEEEEVSYKNPNGDITLGGTMTFPKSDGPFPAVLLITGSGQQNRDEEILGHKPFLVLADYLTRHGIAVLRVDDRGIGKSTGNFTSATTADFASDVLAGIVYLKSRRDVDSKKIGLLGHSEGGLIAPMVATQSKDVAFIVMMAGPSVTGDIILSLQDSLISSVLGAPADEIVKDLGYKRSLFSIIKEENDTTKLRQKLRSVLEESMGGSSQNSAAIDASLKEMMSPWFHFFVTYDPAPTLERVACPVLALYCSKDLQVPAQVNAEGAEKNFMKSGNKNATVKILPGLNHLFQKAETGSPTEYIKIQETINPEALKTIGDWISAVTK